MMNFDFELMGTAGTLFLHGPLQKQDADDLRLILLNSMNQCETLLINLQHVHEVQEPCRRVFQVFYRESVALKKTVRISDRWSGRILLPPEESADERRHEPRHEPTLRASTADKSP